MNRILIAGFLCKKEIMYMKKNKEENEQINSVDNIENPGDKKIRDKLTKQLIILVSIYSFLSLLLLCVISFVNKTIDKLLYGNILRIVCMSLLWTVTISIFLYFFVKKLIELIKPDQKHVFNKNIHNSLLLIISIFISFLSGFVVLYLVGF